jgi:ketosteroid isomerase-like protein
MSEENVEIVRRSLEAYRRGDIEEMLSYVDPEGELRSAIIGGAEGKRFRGHDGFRRWYAESRESFEELTTELTEYRDLGDRVVAFGHIHARGRGSRLEIDSPTGWVFTVRGGKVVGAEGFLGRAETLQAAGLPEEGSSE